MYEGTQSFASPRPPLPPRAVKLPDAPPHLEDGFNCASEEDHGMAPRERIEYLATLPFNNRCADCDTEGVHRSLGVQVSRVRSIELDEWTPQQVERVEKRGNKLCNSVFEAAISSDATKPGPTSLNPAVDAWIKSKYCEQRFKDPFADLSFFREMSSAETSTAHSHRGTIMAAMGSRSSETLSSGSSVSARPRGRTHTRSHSLDGSSAALIVGKGHQRSGSFGKDPTSTLSAMSKSDGAGGSSKRLSLHGQVRAAMSGASSGETSAINTADGDVWKQLEAEWGEDLKKIQQDERKRMLAEAKLKKKEKKKKEKEKEKDEDKKKEPGEGSEIWDKLGTEWGGGEELRRLQQEERKRMLAEAKLKRKEKKKKEKEKELVAKDKEGDKEVWEHLQEEYGEAKEDLKKVRDEERRRMKLEAKERKKERKRKEKEKARDLGEWSGLLQAVQDPSDVKTPRDKKNGGYRPLDDPHGSGVETRRRAESLSRSNGGSPRPLSGTFTGLGSIGAFAEVPSIPLPKPPPLGGSVIGVGGSPAVGAPGFGFLAELKRKQLEKKQQG